MEKKKINNPFAQKGRIITGNDFIGRFEALQSIADQVTELPIPNNVAIIGYPRIGKSSLAKQAIMQKKDALLKENKIAIWVEFSTFSNREAFFKYLVRYSFDSVKQAEFGDIEIEECANQVINHHKLWDDLKYDVEKYFETLQSKGYFTIFVLDEFDEARNKFKNNIEAFVQLRELGYDPERYGVAFITVSRRSIKEIEIQSNCRSTLDGIFGKEYLTMYSEKELAEYYQLYENVGIQLIEYQKQRIEYYCGGHPYLLAILGFEIVEDFRKGFEIDIDNIFNKIRLSFNDYYKQLIDLLEEDGTYLKMLQILFGPMLNVSEDDIQELRDTYGLVKDYPLPDSDKGLIAFSEHFQAYLRGLGRKIDFWSLWTTTETTLREVISKVLSTKHGENWINEVKVRHPELIQKAEETRTKAREDYKAENLLEYFDAQPLFEIITNKKGWNDFKEIFGGDKVKTDFEKKMQLIIKIRNPYAHSRFRSIDSTTVQQAEIYCNEFLQKLNSHLLGIK